MKVALVWVVVSSSIGEVDSFFHPPESLVPFTNNGSTVRIPDLSRTSVFLFGAPNFTQVPSEEALRLLNVESHLPTSKALYEMDLIFDRPPIGLSPTDLFMNDHYPEIGYHPIDPYTIAPNILPSPPLIPKLSRKWTTLSGISLWSYPALMFAEVFQCDCLNIRTVDEEAGAALHVNFNDLLIFPPKNLTDKPSRGKGCSPRVVAESRFRTTGSFNWTTQERVPSLTSPVIREILLAQFDLVVDVLRNERARAVLESIELWGPTTADEEVIGQRIMKVAGLPETALRNMRGFLTMRQYALYQALRRGDHDCPVPETDCGMYGPDRCDRHVLRPEA